MFFHSQTAAENPGKYDLLTVYTGPARLLGAGLLSGILLSGFILGTLRLFAEAVPTQAPFLFPTVRILRFLLFLTAAGTLDTLLLALYKLVLLRMPERDPLSRMGISTLKAVYPLGLWIASWLLFEAAGVYKTISDPIATAAAVTSGGLTAFLLHTVWYRLLHAFLSGLTTVDWKTIVDKRHFTEMLRLLFAESKRYGIPLSLLLLQIKTDDGPPVPRRTVCRLREMLLEEISLTMRAIDTASRLENESHIGILLHTDLQSTVYPIDRIREIFLRCHRALSLPETLTLHYAVTEYQPNMTHERVMYEAVLQKISENPEIFTVL